MLSRKLLLAATVAAVVGGSTAYATTTSPGSYHIGPLPAAAALTCRSASYCVAVGGQSAGLTARFWDGTAWTATQAPGASKYAGLSGVSCPSATSCLAIGENGEIGTGREQFLDRWTGSKWVAQHVPREQATVADIACVSATDCWAVGEHVVGYDGGTYTEHYDGTRWRTVGAPHHKVSTEQSDGVTVGVPYELDSVACPTSRFCLAVGREHDGGYAGQTFVRWNGTRWKLQHVSIPTVSGGLEGIWGISCTSRHFCLAVGGGKYLLSYKWNGTTWSRVSMAKLEGTSQQFGPHLDRIACTSTTRCVATGYRASGKPDRKPLTERWNGNRWRVQDPTGTDQITCDNNARCVVTQ